MNEIPVTAFSSAIHNLRWRPLRHEFHQSTLNTFITSSPRWLMTFTAMQPDVGLSKGREVSRLSVAQASSLSQPHYLPAKPPCRIGCPCLLDPWSAGLTM